MAAPIPLHRLAAFLSTGSDAETPSPLQLHILRGWRESTLLSYNSAVRKFLTFLGTSGREPWTLPASPQELYEFCFWAGKAEGQPGDHDVTAKTLKKYLYGIQAWHTYHDQPYPAVSGTRITVMLRASSVQDAMRPPRAPKSAVRLEHLLLLYHTWIHSSEEDRTCLDCALVAFWGMARLAEVTYVTGEGRPSPHISILRSDVQWTCSPPRSVTLVVRGAKTAKAGTDQHIILNAQPNILCPVKAVMRRMAMHGSPLDALFRYHKPDPVNLTRSRLVTNCAKVWAAHGHGDLSGHSFRVGGASIRSALGIPHADIKRLGRWTSDCYKLYLREYSLSEVSTTLALLTFLNG